MVGGHVAGLALAHDRALAVYRDEQDNVVPSQLWMLAVMILFTISALLLLLSEQRMTFVIAHAGHWLVTIAYFIPVIGFMAWLGVTQLKERRKQKHK